MTAELPESSPIHDDLLLERLREQLRAWGREDER